MHNKYQKRISMCQLSLIYIFFLFSILLNIYLYLIAFLVLESMQQHPQRKSLVHQHDSLIINPLTWCQSYHLILQIQMHKTAHTFVQKNNLLSVIFRVTINSMYKHIVGQAHRRKIASSWGKWNIGWSLTTSKMNGKTFDHYI